ncbi:fused DSP-PTPase phosphatase/NAD kinase-like protein [Aureimonas ureilytica]|uniref:fused DSP-PTPase phosphatase/NAD kinase-like protein n=1 Tax=Aureimonas ureilytica TaxID=401562 RepID=UPI0007343DC9|nr:tyrosine-protein phosphatase [Aureimonas ureilytica]
MGSVGGKIVCLLLASLGASALAVPALLGLTLLGGNLHEVGGGVIRAAQMSPADLASTIQARGVRSILNLRGEHPGEAWWQEERAVAEANGVEYISVSLSARHKPDLAAMRHLAALMRDAPKPLLIHCLQGADRTGLASAIYELSQGQAAGEAADQLSLMFGHFPWLGNKTRAMDEAFAEYSAADATPSPATASMAAR